MIADHLGQSILVGVDVARLQVRAQPQRHAVPLRERAIGHSHLRQLRPHRDALQMEHHLAGFELLDVQDVVDEAMQPPTVGMPAMSISSFVSGIDILSTSSSIKASEAVIAVSGVRSSWLTVAMTFSLSSVVFSAISLSRSARSRSSVRLLSHHLRRIDPAGTLAPSRGSPTPTRGLPSYPRAPGSRAPMTARPPRSSARAAACSPNFAEQHEESARRAQRQETRTGDRSPKRSERRSPRSNPWPPTG